MTPPIRTRPDGTKYPITGKGGGEARTVVAAGAAATLIAAGPSLGGIGVVGGTGASVTGGFSSITSSVMRAKVVKAKKVMRSGKPARAWRQLGLRKGKPRRIARASCVRNSYGQVQTWLRFHPCRSLKRLALPLTDGRGNTVLLTVAWVKMRNANDARNFKRLIDVHGTGDIKPVAMEMWERKFGVEFTGLNYESRRSRTTVVVAESEPLRGSASRDLLQATASVGAYLRWPG
ncbi:hypothetical protein [Thermocrispum agreste]|uniref:Uncharacterized protein n=1 Tax=Thermocrispum agreste TaxID=37925 RepID=A0A2W4JHZ0_9PSEU|nr:hypothetical protein [Thermocrispum agreste]PZM98852.1 MAG: hypothetical protein DIU77_07035 [Thermocrispum agreste]